MQSKHDKTRVSEGLTLVEMVLAVAIMAIVFAALVPQFRAILGSWDSKEANAEALQNGRILIDHLYRNLSAALQITAVSDSSETNGYIELQDNDGNTMRYDIAANNYVEFGPVGNLADLAGPVSQLQFTCYDACDLDTPITAVAYIRCVKVETTLTNPGPGPDKTFTTQAYIRTNFQDEPGYKISKKTPFEFDVKDGKTPALCQIDATHFLCAYEGDGSDGWANILKVNTGNWTITEEAHFEFDQKKGKTPALAQIDQTHYLCAYQGDGDDGWAVVLTISEPLFDAISMETPFEFDTKDGRTPALCKIDNQHYICAYQGDGDDGWAVVLTVDTGNWTISAETPFEFDTKKGKTPALGKLANNYYLCAYQGDGDDGWAVVLKITGSYNITAETPLEFDTNKGIGPALSQIDNDHYLCAYQGDGDDGLAVVLTINPNTKVISKETPFEFDTTKAIAPALSKIDDTHYLCVYEGDASKGWGEVLVVNTTDWTITKDADPYEFDEDKGKYPDLAQIDEDHYLCVYQGGGDDGCAIVLELGETLLP